MLHELAVRDLGVIDELDPRARPGDDRAHRRDRRRQDAAWSRPSSCSSAGGPTRRWCATAPTRPWSRVASCVDDDEVVLARVVPARRSRRGPTSTAAWPPPARWPSWGARPGRPPRPARAPVAARRRRCSASALDRFGGIDLGPLRGRPRPACGASTSRAGRARRRRAGPGPRDRPAALPGRRARRRRPRRPRRGRAPRRRGGRAGRRGGAPGRRRRAAAALDGDDGRGRRRSARPSPRSTGGAVRGPGRPAARRRGRAGRRRRRGARRPARRSTTTPSGWPRCASGASCCTTCAASTARRSPTCSRSATRPQRRLAELEDHDELRRRARPRAAPRRSRAVERGRAAGRRGPPRAPRPTLAGRRRGHLRELAMAKAPARGRGRRTIRATTCAFLLAANPGAPPAAAGEGRVRRRAGPRDAGAAPGAHRDATGPRRWCSTRSTPASAAPPATRGRPALARARRRPPGARRHPPAPGRGVRRHADRGAQATSGTATDRDLGAAARRRRAGRRAVADAVRLARQRDRAGSTRPSCCRGAVAARSEWTLRCLGEGRAGADAPRRPTWRDDGELPS